MQTERVTFLTTPARKASLASRAAAQGISIGEYVRRRVEDEEDITLEQEAELAALVDQVNVAIPEMITTLGQMHEDMRSTHEEVDRMLRAMGARS
jgi:uncharacterized protein YaaN involved in tellurite resistance